MFSVSELVDFVKTFSWKNWLCERVLMRLVSVKEVLRSCGVLSQVCET